jgi:hypothetical protein
MRVCLSISILHARTFDITGWNIFRNFILILFKMCFILRNILTKSLWQCFFIPLSYMKADKLVEVKFVSVTIIKFIDCAHFWAQWLSTWSQIHPHRAVVRGDAGGTLAPPEFGDSEKRAGGEISIPQIWKKKIYSDTDIEIGPWLRFP